VIRTSITTVIRRVIKKVIKRVITTVFDATAPPPTRVGGRSERVVG
jgi:hypothetical protein